MTFGMLNPLATRNVHLQFVGKQRRDVAKRKSSGTLSSFLIADLRFFIVPYDSLVCIFMGTIQGKLVINRRAE